ncbi:MAG: hypothetical protein WAV56_02975 [Microgenomates group bacterium]
MGKSISIESKIFRGVAALAIGAFATACAKENALACGNAEIYPEGEAALPASGSYLVEVPQARACAVEVFADAYQVVYLEIYSGGVVDLIVFENTMNQYGVVFSSSLPTKEAPVEFAFKTMKGKISLTDQGNYLVEYQSR